MRPKLLSASSLNGTSVENNNGDNLGKIEDLMIDWKEGKVSYAVLSFGGFLGMGDKLFAVPLQAFGVPADDTKKVLILDETKERLENSPGFDKDAWPNSADYEFTKKVHKYYNREYNY